MENLVIDTYSRRLQDMARSAAGVKRFCVCVLYVAVRGHVTMICTNKFCARPVESQGLDFILLLI